MHTPLWNLVDRYARAELGPFVAQVSLADPGQGIRLTAREPAVDFWFWGIATEALGNPQQIALEEPHVRGIDLHASYRAAAQGDFQLDACWRLLPPVAGPPPWPAVELALAVRTARLEINPQVFLRSRLPDAETSAGDDDMPGCWLHRFRQSPLTCIEMTSPRDMHSEAFAGQPPRQLVHRLFPDCVEKGVILCSRLRVFLAPRDDDAERARQLYQQFASPEELL